MASLQCRECGADVPYEVPGPGYVIGYVYCDACSAQNMITRQMADKARRTVPLSAVYDASWPD